MPTSPTQRKLARLHLEALLERFRPMRQLQRPPKGWVRAIRDSLGMSAGQLAQRMNLSQPAVAQLEKGEAAGTTTLATLERAAAAMGCRLVYAFVPERSLEDLVREQALKVAAREVASTAHTMELEKQAVSKSRSQEEVRELADELLRTEPRTLWQTI